MRASTDCSNSPSPSAASKLISQLHNLLSDAEFPLLTAAIGVIKDGKVLFSDAVGCKQLGDHAVAIPLVAAQLLGGTT